TRGVRDAGLLVDVQRIEVGTKPDGLRRGPVLQHPDDASAGDPRVDPDPERSKLAGDERARGRFLERGFGMRVQVVAPRAHVRFEGGDFGGDPYVHRIPW